MRDFFVSGSAFSRQELVNLARREMEPSSQVALLAQSLAAGKEVKEVKDSARALYEQILRGTRQVNELQRALELVRALKLEAPGSPVITNLGPGTFYLFFELMLLKPFLSRDDAVFHINENPVKKDKVFRLPMVSPSTWKGNLRSTARLAGLPERGQQMIRLFGNPKAEQSSFQQGRLRFYPTFFDRLGFEIINPHDRERRIGKNPILMECAPKGTKGRFGLLYVAFPEKGAQAGDAGKDLMQVVKLVDEMMTRYGFSAKKSSGYGVIEGTVTRGKLQRPGQAVVPFSSLAELAGKLAEAR